jgi:HEAT repeat protein
MYERFFSLTRTTVMVAGLAACLVTAFPPTATDALRAFQAEDEVARRIDELRDGDARVRRYAAWALGELESSRGVDPLHSRLSDANADVRLVAAWALGEIKERHSIEPLIGLLEDADPLVREMAVLALGEFEHPSVVSAVVEATDRHPELGEPAVWALGEIGGRQAEEARDALIGQLGLDQGENSEVWTGWLGTHEARSMSGDVPALIAALNDGELAMRHSAAEWLGKSGDPRAVDPLLDALRDREPSVRAMAVWALDEINPSRAEREDDKGRDHEDDHDQDQDHENERGIRV